MSAPSIYLFLFVSQIPYTLFFDSIVLMKIEFFHTIYLKIVCNSQHSSRRVLII